MPYINPEYREFLDPAIDHLANALRELECDYPESNVEGNINYAISKLMDSMYRNGGYRAINDAIGVLECVKLEFYRRLAAPYEDVKAKQNGDVYGQN